MKPHLRNGTPVGKSVQPLPARQRVCRCPECSRHQVYDPLVQDFVPGKACGRDEYLRHQRRLEIQTANTVAVDGCVTSIANLRLDSPPMVSSIMLGLPDSGSDSPADASSSAVEPPRRSARQQDTQAARAQLQREADQERIRSTQDAADIYTANDLHERLQELQESVSHVSWKDVIFVHPPSPLLPRGPRQATPRDEIDVNQGPYSLDFQRSANQPIVQHELLLARALVQIEDILAKNRPKVIAALKISPSDIRAQLRYIERRKEEEWERRYNLQATARNIYREGVVDVIDTGTHHRLYSRRR